MTAQNMTFFGLAFHWYGFIVGLAVVSAWMLIEKASKKIGWQPISSEVFFSTTVVGLIGARVWHVLTDWPVYISNWMGVFEIWNGGMSILGAVVTGVVWLGFLYWQKKIIVPFGHLLDAAVFGLPAGQAIGRFANYVNQELYGLPTDLPWGIFIDPPYRLAGYEQFSRFHPLFAYELVATGLAASMVWWLVYSRTPKQLSAWQLGTGAWFVCYVLYYSGVRFLLDWLRPAKALLGIGYIGLNQAVLLLVIVISIIWLWTHIHAKNRSK